MALFEVSQETPHAPEQAWARLVDWPRHGRYVPFTTVRITTAPPNGLGTVFVAHTGVGRFGFDDPMEVVRWTPPVDGAGGHCRLDKRGPVMHGWAELTVEPHGTGARASWREDVSVGKLPRFTDAGTALSSRLLFGRVLRGLLAD